MPRQKPGRSKQDYQTPPEFIAAVKRKLRIREFDIDLAASAENAQAESYIDEEINSLNPYIYWDEYNEGGWSWLNPPFSNIRPWVEKAMLSTSKIAVLVPASVGSNWWREYVHEVATVLFLNGRLTFVGASAPCPKDCALLLYNAGPSADLYYIWEWQKGLL
jgi:DNA (cytosine-5)-methyltransferase 1